MTGVLLEQSDPLRGGQQALGRGAWQEARNLFAAALAAEETPEALEGLGAASWWLGDGAAVFSARERAYRLYRERRDDRGAARAATGLAVDHCTFRGELVVAGGWFRRAERLLKGETCRERGWLLIAKAHVGLLVEHSPATARALAAEAGSLGKALGDIDIEMLGLAYEGLALVDLGDIAAGMRYLDEATVAAVAGEMRDIDSTCTACCCLIYACEKTRDLERAAQWCEQLTELSTRWSYRAMFAMCRTHYAGVLIWRGSWAEAEMVLEEALDELDRTHRAQAAEALVMLAALRCRQGRLDESASLFARAEAHPYRMLAHNPCLLGRAALALEREDAEAAVELAERFLRAVPAEVRLERAAGLELLVRAHVALGNTPRAEEALTELRSVAGVVVASGSMQAALRFAEGLVAAEADPASAKACFEDAVELWTGAGAPFEAARGRVDLGRILFRLGRRAAAQEEVSKAVETLHAIGALRAASRAQALARELDQAGTLAAQVASSGPLSGREIEVLRLVAQGLTNKQIASRLCRSEHTVHRHVANIFTKLDLPSRAAAVSYAAKHGLV
jgi:DNA-binding CsgD family transcriptional regulator